MAMFVTVCILSMISNFDETTERWVLKEGVPDVTEELLTNSGQYFGPGHLKLKYLMEMGILMQITIVR